MTLSREAMLQLMSLVDGELDGDDRARAEKLVASSAEARGVVEAMRARGLGGFLGPMEDDRAASAGADGIADAVMAQVAALAPAGGTVTRIGEARARRGSRVVAAMAAAAALAAGAALLMRSGMTGAPVPAPVASVPSTADSLVAFQQAGPASAIEVNEVDSPSRGISVFEIPMIGAAAAQPSRASTVVVWIDDEPGSK